MGKAFKSVSLLAAIAIICLITPYRAFSKELVGVLPFANQRINPSDNWLGYYIQARMQSFLENNCDCSFHSLETIHLWQNQASFSTPISVGSKVIISGSFQVVLEQGLLEVTLNRISPVLQSQAIKIDFSIGELELKLDQLSLTIANWIGQKSKKQERIDFPGHTEKGIKELFRLREKLYQPGMAFDMNLLRKPLDYLKIHKHNGFVADVVTGMLYASESLTIEENKRMLAQAEQLLRTAASGPEKNARIHALLAQVFFQSGKETSWIIKTAEQAFEQDKYNELAILMLILANAESEDNNQSLIKQLNDVNPWIWPDETKNESQAQFQKGRYQSELLSLHESLR